VSCGGGSSAVEATLRFALRHRRSGRGLLRALKVAASKAATSCRGRLGRAHADQPKGRREAIAVSAVSSARVLTAGESTGHRLVKATRRGASRQQRPRVGRGQGLPPVFPPGTPTLNRELSPPWRWWKPIPLHWPAKIGAKIDAIGSLEDVYHYLIGAGPATLCPIRGLDQPIASALLASTHLTEKQYTRDSNWPLRIAELHADWPQGSALMPPSCLALFRPAGSCYSSPLPGFDVSRRQKSPDSGREGQTIRRGGRGRVGGRDSGVGALVLACGLPCPRSDPCRCCLRSGTRWPERRPPPTRYGPRTAGGRPGEVPARAGSPQTGDDPRVSYSTGEAAAPTEGAKVLALGLPCVLP